MKNSQYLYGRQFDAKEIQSMPYAQALEYKLRCAKELIRALAEANVEKTDWHRINNIGKAIKFNEALVAETKGKD